MIQYFYMILYDLIILSDNGILALTIYNTVSANVGQAANVGPAQSPVTSGRGPYCLNCVRLEAKDLVTNALDSHRMIQGINTPE